MLVYVVMILVLLIAHNGVESSVYISEELYVKKRKRYTIFVIICLVTVFGLRGTNVGIDTKEYCSEYMNSARLVVSRFARAEIGFYSYNYLLHDILGLPWQVYLVLTAFLLVIPLLLFINKYSENIFYSVFLFITIGNLTIYLSGLRQSLACSFCLLAYLILDSGSGKRFIRAIASGLVICLAYLFHNSSVVFVIILVLHYIKPRLRKRTIYVLIVLSLLLLFFGWEIINIFSFLIPSKYSYIDLNKHYAQNPLLTVIAVLIPLFCSLVSGYKMYDLLTVEDSMMYIGTLLNLSCVCLAYVNGQIGRLVFYFAYANTILIPNSLQKYTTRNRTLFYLLIAAFCIAYFFIGTINGQLQIDNYRFFWEI